MSSCLTQVREQLQDLLERLFSDIPNLKVAVIAHGDYCDVNHYYVTRMVDFTNDLAALSEFVKDVGATGGGDWEECYELVLHQARTQLGWGAAPGTQRSLVMVGDAVPHEPEYHLNTLNLDWREQTDLLKEQLGVRIYSVQCQDDGTARKFWQELAERSKGRYLQLTEFRTILDIMMAICYREKGAEFFDAYETEVRCREGSAIRPELTNLFTALRDGAPRDDGSDVTPTATPRATPTKRARVMPGGAAKKRKTVTPRPAAPRAQLTKITKVRRPPAAGNRRRAKTAAATAIRRAALQHADSLTAAQKPLTPPVKKVAPARLIRETQHEKQFRPDSALTWADWQPCFSHCQLPTGTWERRRAGRPGYRRLDLFWGHTLVPAVYEFAVQVPGSSLCKKHVMYQRTTRGFSALWDGYLVRHAHITAQLDRVLGDRCTVYVRRALLGNTRAVEDVRAQFGRYDYAWSPRGKERRTRRVVRRGVLLAASS